MARINVREKGARREREFAAVLKSHGFHAERSVQNCGRPTLGGEVPDLNAEMPFDIAWEVKGVENLNVVKAWEKAKEDALESMPIVAHKKNNKPWLVTLSADDFLRIMQAYEDLSTAWMGDGDD